MRRILRSLELGHRHAQPGGTQPHLDAARRSFKTLQIFSWC